MELLWCMLGFFVGFVAYALLGGAAFGLCHRLGVLKNDEYPESIALVVIVWPFMLTLFAAYVVYCLVSGTPRRPIF